MIASRITALTSLRRVALVALMGCAAWVPVTAQADEAATQGQLQAAWAPFLRIEAVTVDPNDLTHEATGKISYDEDHTQYVLSPLAGRVLEVHVHTGQMVQVGDKLLTLASPEATQLWAEVHRSRLALAAAKRQTERTRALQRDGAVAEREVVAVQAEYRMAQAGLQSAEAQLQALGLTLDAQGTRATLVAQQAGRVTQRRAAVGQQVGSDSAEPLVTVSDLSNVWLLADVFEQDLSAIALGRNVQVEVSAYPGRAFTGKVTYIHDVIDPGTRTVKVRARLANPQQQLKPDMFARAHFEQAAKGALFIPARALVGDANQQAVLVVGPKDHVAVRPVRVGPLRQGRYRVLEGLAEGERLIVQGAPFVLESLRG